MAGRHPKSTKPSSRLHHHTPLSPYIKAPPGADLINTSFFGAAAGAGEDDPELEACYPIQTLFFTLKPNPPFVCSISASTAMKKQTLVLAVSKSYCMLPKYIQDYFLGAPGDFSSHHLHHLRRRRFHRHQLASPTLPASYGHIIVIIPRLQGGVWVGPGNGQGEVGGKLSKTKLWKTAGGFDTDVDKEARCGAADRRTMLLWCSGCHEHSPEKVVMFDICVP